MTTTDAADDRGWRDFFASGRLPRFVLITLGVWLNAADSLVVATIMPSVGADLGGLSLFSWSVAGFMVGAILSAASAGRISEILGLRLATTVGGVVFVAGCAIGALAPTMPIFLAGRLLQGIGGGWIAGFAMVAIAELFPGRHLPRMFASVSAVWGIATVIGPLVGGVFAEAGSWRAVFWLFAAQALAFTLAAPFLFKGLKRPASAPGIPWTQLGMLGLAIAAIGLADGIGGAGLALPLVAAGLLTLFAMVRFDARAVVRLLPRGAEDPRSVCGAGYLALFATTAAAAGLTVYGAAFMQRLHGLSPLWAGYAVGAEALAWSLAAFFVARARGDGERRYIAAGGAIVFAGVALLAVVTPTLGVAAFVAGAVVVGVGFGIAGALINRRIIAVLSAEDRAIGSSALIGMRQVGNAVGAALSGVAANLAGFGATFDAGAAGTAAVAVFAAGLPFAVVGALASWWMVAGRA